MECALSHAGALRDKAVRHVSCGWRHTCVVTYEGELWTFGAGILQFPKVGTLT